MNKVIFVVGARPQIIKLAPLYYEMRKNFNTIIVHTGQHFHKNMSDIMFSDLNIPLPDFNLQVNRGLHGNQTGRMLIEIEKVVIKESPHLVIVFGDTNSTLAGALVAVKLHIPVVHIEAGLRSHNKEMPEEINRIVTDHISDYLFAPVHNALINLKKEGLEEKSFYTGDIMQDVLKSHEKISDRNSNILTDLNLKPKNYVLATLHRPYNVDDYRKLIKIFSIFEQYGKTIIFPVHPRTKEVIQKHNIRIPNNVKLFDPIGYLDFIKLLKNSIKVVTDSGGIQKESYILGIPCITVRSETEWVETVEVGWNLLIGEQLNHLFSALEKFEPSGYRNNIFGDGYNARGMAKILENI